MIIAHHSYEYPNYYDKLYKLLHNDLNPSKSLFLNSENAVFKKILEVSLRSSKINLLTSAKFVKSLLKISLSLPTSQ